MENMADFIIFLRYLISRTILLKVDLLSMCLGLLLIIFISTDIHLILARDLFIDLR